MTTKLRFATLTRVSTEQQEDRGESLRTQEAQLRDAVAKLGGEITVTYGGTAEHATDGYERKELERLLRDAQKQPQRFHAVIVTDPDRWSRSNQVSQRGLEILRDNGIQFFSGTTAWDLFNPSHVLFLGMNAEVGKFFATNQAKKSLENKISRAKRGLPTCGKLPFGRKFIRSADRQTGIWEVDPVKQAMIVDCAKRYLAGESISDLAKEYGVNWANLWKTLTKTSGTKWPLLFASKHLNISEEVTMTIPPLLDNATIAAVLEKAEQNRTYLHGHPKYQYLFAQAITCKHCGYVMSGQTNRSGLRYYRHAHAERDRVCPGPERKAWIPAQAVEDAVTRQLFEIFGNPEAIKRAVEEATPDREATAELMQRLERITAELTKLEAGRQRILDLILKGTIPEATADKKLEEAKEREAKLVEERNKLSDQLAHLPSREAVTAAAVKIAGQFRQYTNTRAGAKGRLANADFEGMSYAEKQALVRSVFAGKGLDGKRLGVQISWAADGKAWRYHINGQLVDLEGSSLGLLSYLPNTSPLEPRSCEPGSRRYS